MGEATKATEVLDVLTKKGTAFLSQNDLETIRKALELLDKVESGGEPMGMVPIYLRDIGRCTEEDFREIASQIKQCIADKYILIEREK
jgi:hypothetical protein